MHECEGRAGAALSVDRGYPVQVSPHLAKELVANDDVDRNRAHHRRYRHRNRSQKSELPPKRHRSRRT